MPNLYHERRARRARAWRGVALATILLAATTAAVLLAGPTIGGHRLVVLTEVRDVGRAELLPRARVHELLERRRAEGRPQ